MGNYQIIYFIFKQNSVNNEDMCQIFDGTMKLFRVNMSVNIR